MPVTYYTELEYKDLKSKSEVFINELCLVIRRLKNLPCCQAGDCMCCGECEFHTYLPHQPRCTSPKKYLSK